MSRYKLWLLVPALVCALGALFVGGSLGVTQVKVGSLETVGSGWFTTLWGLIGGGAAFSLPALFALIQKFIPKLSLGSGVDPKIATVISAAQLTAYYVMLQKATTDAERDSLSQAARASCDNLRDALFPFEVIGEETS